MISRNHLYPRWTSQHKPTSSSQSTRRWRRTYSMWYQLRLLLLGQDLPTKKWAPSWKSKSRLGFNNHNNKMQLPLRYQAQTQWWFKMLKQLMLRTLVMLQPRSNRCLWSAGWAREMTTEPLEPNQAEKEQEEAPKLKINKEMRARCLRTITLIWPSLSSCARRSRELMKRWMITTSTPTSTSKATAWSPTARCNLLKLTPTTWLFKIRLKIKSRRRSQVSHIRGGQLETGNLEEVITMI